MNDDRTEHLKAAICVTTRNREKMLTELLGTFSEMVRPEDVELIFVVIENNDAMTLDPVVENFRKDVPDATVVYENEPDIGIPLARNTACRVALRNDANVILFVDDDETIAPDWLERIVACYRTGDVMLLGGPVMPAQEAHDDDWWRRMIRSGVEHRYLEKARKAETRHRTGAGDRVTIVTNNWLADASIFTRHEIWFDNSLRYTGGSDTRFWRDVRDAGLKTGWCPEAVVYETIPDERASFRYQMRRAMEQSRTSLHAKLRDTGMPKATLEFLPILALRSVSLLGVALSLPVTKGPGLIRLARGLGWAAGRITGLMGARSTLYTKTTGS